MSGGGSLGIRSGSYGSLDKQLQNGGSLLPVQQTSARTKPSKMFKEKEGLVYWICKFAGRKKVGMLLLCVISAAVFLWVLYVGKGEDAQEGDQVPNLRLNDSLSINYSESSPIYREQTKKMYNETSFNNIESQNSIANSVEPMDKMVSVRPIESTVFPPPPPSYFLGYTLPPGHPCNSFTLPPPPADKKRTGPRRLSKENLAVERGMTLTRRTFLIWNNAMELLLYQQFLGLLMT